MVENNVWTPGFEEDYFMVDLRGEVIHTMNCNSATDKQIFEFGNYFKTKEEAEEMASIVKDMFISTKEEEGL